MILADLAGLADGAAIGVTVRQDPEQPPWELVLVRIGNQVRGYLNRCPHAGSPLDWTPGRFLTVDGRHLLCATHGAVFSKEDGRCLDGPCRGGRLTPVAVAVRNGKVMLCGETGDPETV